MSTAYVLLLVSLAPWLACAQGNGCAAFQSALKSTYDFKPAKLSGADRESKSAAMDKIWAEVKADPKELAPCLESALEDPGADAWFLFDGSGLLLMVDPSPEANQLILRGCEKVDFDDIDLSEWIRRLTRLAIADIDISTAAARWMAYPNPRYVLPRHAFTANKADGAFFLYGSMDEAQATPALQRIVSDVSHPARSVALELLSQQLTPQSLDVLHSLDHSGFPTDTRKAVERALKSPQTLQPRLHPKTTRAEFVSAFQAIVNRDFGPFMDLVEKVPDGEKDVVAVMSPADLPLIRKVRRCLAATGNPHQMDMYPFFTRIIQTLLSAKSA